MTFKQIEKMVSNLSEEEAKDMLVRYIENCYEAVQWPESQDIMTMRWFKKEAILDVDGLLGSSTYLVPIHRML
jgi:hypothetical protein